MSIQKCLVLIGHLVSHGSEKAVNEAWALGAGVEKLRNFNTVLSVEEHEDVITKSVGGIWGRIKGGRVDTGGPVRDAADDLHSLLRSADRVRAVREGRANRASLVPLGCGSDYAYLSDEQRLRILKDEMSRKLGAVGGGTPGQLSNLKKAEGGFGSGLNSRDGKTVVGAAHGIDEMLAMAERERRRYTDVPDPRRERDDVPNREELMELQRQLGETGTGTGGGGGGGEVLDLLDVFAPPSDRPPAPPDAPPRTADGPASGDAPARASRGTPGTAPADTADGPAVGTSPDRGGASAAADGDRRRLRGVPAPASAVALLPPLLRSGAAR